MSESLSDLVVRLRALTVKATLGRRETMRDDHSPPTAPSLSGVVVVLADALDADGRIQAIAAHVGQDDAPLLAALDPTTLLRLLDALDAVASGPDEGLAAALILCRRAVEAAPVSECDETCPHDCHAALMREAIAALAALKALDEGGPP